MLTDQELRGISIDILTEVPNFDDSVLIEYINRIVQELCETKSQQMRLDKHVEQLTQTTVVLMNRVGKLTHFQEQLDAKVRTLVEGVDEAKSLSGIAVDTANSVFREMELMKSEAFGLVDERLVSLGEKVDKFVDSI